MALGSEPAQRRIQSRFGRADQFPGVTKLGCRNGAANWAQCSGVTDVEFSGHHFAHLRRNIYPAIELLIATGFCLAGTDFIDTRGIAAGNVLRFGIIADKATRSPAHEPTSGCSAWKSPPPRPPSRLLAASNMTSTVAVEYSQPTCSLSLRPLPIWCGYTNCFLSRLMR